MDWFTILVFAAGGAVLLIAVLAAYGAWLIGRGGEAEMQARAMAGQRNVDRLAVELEQTGRGGFRERPMAEQSNAVMSTGWLLLDKLRTGDVPLVSRIERVLGLGPDASDGDGDGDDGARE